MNLTETKMLLAKAALIDNRAVGELTIRAWQEVLANVDARDAMEALTLHFHESEDYLNPGHIVSGVRRVRENRRIEAQRQAALESAAHAARQPYETERGPALPTNPEEMKRLLRERFPEDFERGVREGNAERAYNTILRETGDRRAATTERARILGLTIAK